MSLLICCSETRFPNNLIEFNGFPEYGFEEWLAFPAGFVIDKTKSASEVKADCINDIKIINKENEAGRKTGAAVITINTITPVKLVPWCNNRPALDQRR